MSSHLTQITSETETQSRRSLLEVPVDQIPSAVLKRLVDEVRNEEAQETNSYSRFHNRHNRSGYTRFGGETK